MLGWNDFEVQQRGGVEQRGKKERVLTRTQREVLQTHIDKEAAANPEVVGVAELVRTTKRIK